MNIAPIIKAIRNLRAIEEGVRNAIGPEARDSILKEALEAIQEAGNEIYAQITPEKPPEPTPQNPYAVGTTPAPEPDKTTT
jgi:hypothetical protein